MHRPRSEDLLPQTLAERQRVAVIGAGAIGSNAVYLLAKMGIGTIYVWDDDVVSEENLEPQFYIDHDVGRHKVDAIRDAVSAYVDDVIVWAVAGRYDQQRNNLRDCDIVISGVDSMESRRSIAQGLRYADGWRYYIDLRMGGNIVEMHIVTPETLADYASELESTEPLEIPCSMRSTAYNGMLAASLAARAVSAILNRQPLPEHVEIDLMAWNFDVGLQTSQELL